MYRVNWGVLIPTVCIISACAIFWGKQGAGYALFATGVVYGLAYFLGKEEE